MKSHAEMVSNYHSKLFKTILTFEGDAQQSWTELWETSIAMLNTNTNTDPIAAMMILFDLFRHGLFFDHMLDLTGNWFPNNVVGLGDNLGNAWEAERNDRLSGIHNGVDWDQISTYLVDLATTISMDPNFNDGLCMYVFCCIYMDQARNTIQSNWNLASIVELCLLMMKIPTDVALHEVAFVKHDVLRQCNQYKTDLQWYKTAFKSLLQRAAGDKNSMKKMLEYKYSGESVCSMPIRTYASVSDSVWLCCTLTLKKLVSNAPDQWGNAVTTHGFANNIAWAGILGGVIDSHHIAEKDILTGYYARESGELVVTASIKQDFLKRKYTKNTIRTLQKKIAIRNTNSTSGVEGRYKFNFHSSGVVCIMEQWAISCRPIAAAGAAGAAVVMPTMTLANLLSLLSKNVKTREDLYGDYTRVGRLQAAIHKTCKNIDDPIESGVFDLPTLFRKNNPGSVLIYSGSHQFVNWMTVHGYMRNVSTFDVDINSMRNRASRCVNELTSAYKSAWGNAEFGRHADEWKHRLQDEMPQHAYHLKTAFASIASLNASVSLADATPPVHNNNNKNLCKCLENVRALSRTTKACMSMLSHFIDMLKKGDATQSRTSVLSRSGNPVALMISPHVSYMNEVVEKIHNALSKQHLRVCRACESFHGCIESSIPTETLLVRVVDTLGAVRRIVTTTKVQNVFKSVAMLSAKLLESGNMDKYQEQLRYTHDMSLRASGSLEIANDDVYNKAILELNMTLPPWVQVYENYYKPNVVNALLHTMLASDEHAGNVVAVAYDKPDASPEEMKQEEDKRKAVEYFWGAEKAAREADETPEQAENRRRDEAAWENARRKEMVGQPEHWLPQRKSYF
jgi:hypothetical protein